MPSVFAHYHRKTVLFVSASNFDVGEHRTLDKNVWKTNYNGWLSGARFKIVMSRPMLFNEFGELSDSVQQIEYNNS